MKNAISIRTTVGLGVILCLGLAVPGMAKLPGGGGGGGTSCGYNVTTVVDDIDTNTGFTGLPLEIQSDSNQNGGSETYTTGNNVYSQILRGCDWTLNLRNQDSRKVNLTFYYAKSTENGGAPFVGQTGTPVAAGIDSSCQNNPANSVNFGTMTGGQLPIQCPMIVVFSYEGYTYQMTMDPNGANSSGSTYVQVACNSAANLPCTGWTVNPVPGDVNPDTTPAGEPAAIGALFRETTSSKGGKVTLTPLGLYYVAFSFTISK